MSLVPDKMRMMARADGPQESGSTQPNSDSDSDSDSGLVSLEATLLAFLPAGLLCTFHQDWLLVPAEVGRPLALMNDLKGFVLREHLAQSWIAHHQDSQREYIILLPEYQCHGQFGTATAVR
eukprot:118440-Rhodomonas_salina.2